MSKIHVLKINDISSAISYVIMSREKRVGENALDLKCFLEIAENVFYDKSNYNEETDEHYIEIEPSDVQDLVFDLLFNTYSMDAYAKKKMEIEFDSESDEECLSLDNYKRSVVDSITETIINKWLLDFVQENIDTEVWEDLIHKFYE